MLRCDTQLIVLRLTFKYHSKPQGCSLSSLCFGSYPLMPRLLPSDALALTLSCLKIQFSQLMVSLASWASTVKVIQVHCILSQVVPDEPHLEPAIPHATANCTHLNRSTVWKKIGFNEARTLHITPMNHKTSHSVFANCFTSQTNIAHTHTHTHSHTAKIIIPN